MATASINQGETGSPVDQARKSSEAAHVAEIDIKEEYDTHEGPPVSAFATLTRAQALRKFWRIYVIGLMVCLGGMYVGYAYNVVGNLVANQGFINQFGTVKNPETGVTVLDAHHVSLWAALSTASQIVFQLLSPITADRFGRKFNMWALMFFLTLSIVLAIVSQEYICLAMSRLASGCATGFIGTSIMVYLSEIAVPQFRGALLGGFSLAMAFGQLFIAVGLKVLNDYQPMKFRNIFYSEFIFFVLFLVPLVLIPESPVWYASKGRHEDAKKALRRLVGNMDDYDIEREYAVIRYELESSIHNSKSRSDNSWKAMLTKTNIKRTIVATLPFSFQNVVGMPLIFGFSTYFFSLANLDDPFLGTLIIYLILVVGIFTGFYNVELLGRRTLVIWGGALMGLTVVAVGGLGFLPPTTASGIGLITLCSLWTFIYANSLAPIGWISVVEVSTSHLRAKTAAVATCLQSLMQLIFTYCIPLLLSDQGANWGQKIGFFFGGLTFLYLIPVIFLFPETKGRTYQELDELFNRGVPAWKFHKTQTTHQVVLDDQRQKTV